MIFHYPKYLRTSPHFVGLSINDLMLLVGSLIMGLSFNLSPLGTLGLIIFVIGTSKIIESRFPRNFFTFYFLKKETLKWRDGYLTLMNRGTLI